MAGPNGCDRDECQGKVNWLLTRLNPPGTISSCDDDMAPFMIGLLAGELAVDGGRMYDAVKRFVDREAAAAVKAAQAEQAAQAEHGHDGQGDDGQGDGIPPMSRQAAEQTESGGLVIDQGPPS